MLLISEFPRRVKNNQVLQSKGGPEFFIGEKDATGRASLFLVSSSDCRDQVLIECSVAVIVRFPIPISTSSGIIHLFWPGVHDLLAAGVDIKIDFCLGEGFQDDLINIFGGEGERGHIIDDLGDLITGASANFTNALTASGMTMKGILVSGRTKQE